MRHPSLRHEAGVVKLFFQSLNFFPSDRRFSSFDSPLFPTRHLQFLQLLTYVQHNGFPYNKRSFVQQPPSWLKKFFFFCQNIFGTTLNVFNSNLQYASDHAQPDVCCHISGRFVEFFAYPLAAMSSALAILRIASLPASHALEFLASSFSLAQIAKFVLRLEQCRPCLSIPRHGRENEPHMQQKQTCLFCTG